MEHPSGLEQRSPENPQPTYPRPPGMEFAMGVSLVGMMIMVFFIVQIVVFISGVLRHSPDLASEGFSFSLLSDPRMEERMSELVFHGDLVAQEAIWSGAICTLLIYFAVRLWKRTQTAQFLGFSTMFMGLGMVLMKPTTASDGLRQALQANKTLLMIVMSGLLLVVLAILFRFFYQFSGLL